MGPQNLNLIMLSLIFATGASAGLIGQSWAPAQSWSPAYSTAGSVYQPAFSQVGASMASSGAYTAPATIAPMQSFTQAASFAPMKTGYLNQAASFAPLQAASFAPLRTGF